MENEDTKKQHRFLVEWSILNFLGLVVGFIFVFLMAYNLEMIKHRAWVYGLVIDFRKEWVGETAFVWLPLGLSIGVLQWVKLRRFGINLFVWASLTALGCAALATLYSWVLDFGSFEYQRQYDIPYWIINLGLAITLPIGGLIIGSLQSLVIRKQGWIKAYVFGLLLPSIVAPLAILVKSFFLNLFYSFRFLYIFADLRWYLLFAFLCFITALCVSILTGKILVNQSNLEHITIKAG